MRQGVFARKIRSQEQRPNPHAIRRHRIPKLIGIPVACHAKGRTIRPTNVRRRQVEINLKLNRRHIQLLQRIKKGPAIGSQRDHVIAD